MAIVWGRALDEPTYSRLDDAIDRGFDPGEDHNVPPAQHLALAADDEWLVALAASVDEWRRLQLQSNSQPDDHKEAS